MLTDRLRHSEDSTRRLRWINAGFSALAIAGMLLVARSFHPSDGQAALAPNLPELRTSPPTAQPRPSPGASLGTSLGRLESADSVLELFATGAGLRYRVIDRASGRVLGDGLTPQQLAQSFPHLDPAALSARVMLADPAQADLTRP